MPPQPWTAVDPDSTGEVVVMAPYFRTLSAWRDRASLDAMVGTEPHRSMMGRHRAAMAESRFTGPRPPPTPPVSWDEARRRLVPAA